jgi:hypothetical protein
MIPSLLLLKLLELTLNSLATLSDIRIKASMLLYFINTLSALKPSLACLVLLLLL